MTNACTNCFMTWRLTCCRILRRCRSWKKQLLVTRQTWSQNVSYEHTQVMYDSWWDGLMISLSTDKLRSTLATRWSWGQVPSQMTSVFPSFSLSWRDTHESLVASMHHFAFFLASCFSNWSRCKQLFFVSKDVVSNVVCIEDNEDILVWHKSREDSYGREYGSERPTLLIEMRELLT